MKFRTKQFIIVLILGLALVTAFLFIQAYFSAPPRPTAILADGTRITIEAVTYGTNHVFVRGSRLLVKTDRFVPAFVNRWLSSPLFIGESCSEETLILWYSVYDPSQKKCIFRNVSQLTVVDDHGCVFPVNEYRRNSTFHDFSVSSAKVTVFPRRQKMLTFRAEFENQPAVDIQFRNPLFPSAANEWTPETLPATRKTNGTEFTLTSITRVGQHIVPEFKIVPAAVATAGWYAFSTVCHDATGNRSDSSLCPYEHAWKLDVDVYKTERASFPEKDIFRPTDITVPPAGEFLKLERRHEFANISIRIIALLGAGEFIFSNEVCVSAAPWRESETENLSADLSSHMRRRRGPHWISQSMSPALLVQIDGVRNMQELLVRAHSRDGLNRLSGYGAANQLRYSLKDFTNGQPLAIEFIHQKPIRLQFVVSPPRPTSAGRAHQ